MSKGGLLDLQRATQSVKSTNEVTEGSIVNLRYKIAVFGQAGAGKSATIATLCRRPVPERHVETPGIQISRLIWPFSTSTSQQSVSEDNENHVTPAQTTIVLDFWDCGSAALSRFDYLRENMLRHADGAMFVVSVCDRPGFNGLLSNVSRTLQDRRNAVVTFAYCTHIDEPFKVEVMEHERKLANMSVESICNTPLTQETANRNYMSLIAPKLNRICERLLAHDQTTLTFT